MDVRNGLEMVQRQWFLSAPQWITLSTGAHSSLKSHIFTIYGALWSALHAAFNGLINHFTVRSVCECVTHEHRERRGESMEAMCGEKVRKS